MTAPAIKATFSDFRLVKGRKVAQLVFEVPIEGADQALETLGGVPRMDKEAWVGIARINPAKTSEKPASEPPAQSSQLSGDKIRRRFSELPLKQRAAMRCAEPAFQRFLSEVYPTKTILDAYEAASLVRSHCGVNSRAEITEGSDAGRLWLALEGEFDLWMRAPA